MLCHGVSRRRQVRLRVRHQQHLSQSALQPGIGLPISMGASVNYTPAYDLQLRDIPSSSVGAKVVTDAFAVWFINPSAQLRFSANNLLPRNYSNTGSIPKGTQRQDSENANPSKVRWGVRLELKL